MRRFGRGGRPDGESRPAQRDYAYDRRDDNSQRYKAFLDSMKYEKMSNLVLKPDRRFIETRGKDEGTGMPESMSGRFRIREMGDALPSFKKRRQAEVDYGKLAEDVELRELQQKKQKAEERAKLEASGILTAEDFRIEGLTYFPKSAATRDIYDKIAHLVSRYIGDETVQVLRSATDSVIESLMKTEISAKDQKQEIEEITGKLGDRNYTELFNLSRKIDDFSNTSAEATVAENEDAETSRMLRDFGTNILLDQEDNSKAQPIVPPSVQDYTKGIIDVATPGEVSGLRRLKLKEKKPGGDGADNEAENVLMADVVDEESDGGGEGSAKVSRTPSAVGVNSRDWMFDVEALKEKLLGLGGLEESGARDLAVQAFGILRKNLDDEEPLDDEAFEDALLEIFQHDDFLDVIPGLVANKSLIILKQKWEQAAIDNGGDAAARSAVERELINHGEKEFLEDLWASKWRDSADNSSDRELVEQDMVASGHTELLASLKAQSELLAERANGGNGPRTLKFGSMENYKKRAEAAAAEKVAAAAAGELPRQQQQHKDKSAGNNLKPRGLVDLETLSFVQGNHFLSTRDTKLPKGSLQVQEKHYTEIRIPEMPAPRDADKSQNVPVSAMPGWAQKAFGNSQSLNRIQSKCYPVAFESDDNMLVCAPTGSGKTNVAMLAMLREIGKHRNPTTGTLELDEFKIVYIAPLKALVAEQVGNFGKRLAPYGIKVSELTGDRQLTKQQIAETHIIVTTPEKWDVITRKATDTSYTHLVRLICIDEVHLLHDERGPVIESIVTRTLRRTIDQLPVRLVALSATLPNYLDVADFLHVDSDRGLFFFDNSYRPCPLRQEYVGISKMMKPIKQVRLMDEICHNKVIHHAGENRNQMIIFVHSRKETARTAKFIKNKLVDTGEITKILRPDAASREILQQESNGTTNADLKDLLPYGFAIHHAGMTRPDRATVEDLFAERHVQVLVSTATLAWGVNLPAHTVIIKGTQVYSPEKGSWVPLSPQDVLQMLGRAGRPQFDTFGEGIIITSMDEVKYYLSLLNQQLPIESQLGSKLADSLNAEVVLGNVRNRNEGSEWLENTYLYVRMLASPGLYGLGVEDNDDLEAGLPQRRVDLIHTAATMLHKCSLVDYNPETGVIRKTELGTIASHYYITHNSMATYKEQLDDLCGMIDLFRIFAMSEEFKHIPIRHDEKEELDQIINRVPIPIKETRDEPLAKINLLLQTYISRLKLDGFALVADMVYVTQSAGRLMRAVFEICLKRGWARATKAALALCQMVEHRMWSTQSPLRQFAKFHMDKPAKALELIYKVERKNVRWHEYLEQKDNLEGMGELLGDHKIAREVATWVGRFPHVEVHAQAQPITRSQLHITLEIAPAFEWVDEVHGAAQLFWILIENDEGRKILFHDQLLIKKEFITGELSTHHVNCMVQIETPLPPCYFVTVIADRWMGSVTRHPLMLDQLIVPEKFDKPARFDKNLTQVALSDLKPEHRYLYPNLRRFNVLQSHVFEPLYKQDDDIFVGASNLGTRHISAELALLRHWSLDVLANAPAVYIAPFQVLVDIRLKDWVKRFGYPDGLGKRIAKLTGDVAKDVRLLAEHDLVLATPLQWDLLSRQWQRRQRVQDAGLFIADEVHLIGSQGGHVYEAIITRMMNMRDLLEDRIAERGYSLRFVGLSVPVANSSDLADFLGAFSNNFNFEPRLRSVPLIMEFQQFSIPHFPSLMLAMVKPAYNTILENSPATPVIIFVPNRKYARSIAGELLTICENTGNRDRFLPETDNDYSAVYDKLNETTLHGAASHGIGYYHGALDKTDKGIVQRLFQAGALQILVVTRDCCWEIQADAHLVIIMGTQYYEGKEHRYVDYAVPDIIQMLGKATKPDPGEAEKRVRGVVMLPASKVNYYKKFLSEPFPVESQLYVNVADSFMSDIVSRNFEKTQNALDWVTFSFLYRRVQSNPSYYGVSGHLADSIRSWFENDVVEATLNEMTEAKVIEYEEEQITPLPPLQIAAHYNLSFITIQTMLLSLSAKSNHRVILEVVCAATELADIPLRRLEDGVLRELYERFRPRPSSANVLAPEFKAFMLLSAHFHRHPLNLDLEEDQHFVVKKAYDLLGACTDVLSSDGHLNAQRAIEIMQFVVQGMFDDDSPLKQIPGFGDREVGVAKKHGVEDVEAFINAMDPDENPDYEKLVAELGFDHTQLQLAADFANDHWPAINMSFSMETSDDNEPLAAGEQNMLSVEITRDNFDEDGFVHAPLFPVEDKKETWFVLVGDANDNRMFGIRRVALSGETTTVQLPYIIDEPGSYELMVVLMSGDYVGTDLEQRLKVTVVEGMDIDEE